MNPGAESQANPARSPAPASALYEGKVFHVRREPVEHRLTYPLFMTLLDLDELPEALDRHPLWSARRPAPIRFNPADYLRGEGPAAARERREPGGMEWGGVPDSEACAV